MKDSKLKCPSKSHLSRREIPKLTAATAAVSTSGIGLAQQSSPSPAGSKTGCPGATGVPVVTKVINTTNGRIHILHQPAYDSTTRATIVFNGKREVVNDFNSDVRKILQNA